jgi:tripartite-type tricarboxylate transporter receptor subunit TctC
MSTKRRGLCHSLLLAAVIVLAPATLDGQDTYPTRPIQLVVPVPPGGAADFIARTVGAKLADALGQSVVINNRGGAGGTIASAGVAKADPDGYTLLLSSITTHGIGPHLYASLPYDPVKDFLPIILLAKLPLIMTVNASVPAASTCPSCLPDSSSSPQWELSSGNGGAPHLASRRAVQEAHGYGYLVTAVGCVRRPQDI